MPNPGWFRKGFDPRRHLFTREERVRGGMTTSRKFLVIGRWELDPVASVAQARRAKPNITTVELRWLRRQLAAVNNATFVAYLDNKARLKLPTTNSVQNLQGTWKSSFAYLTM